SSRHRVAALLIGALLATQVAIGVQASRARASARLARTQARLAMHHETWIRLLASSDALQEAETRAGELFPAWPPMRPRLEAWIADHGQPMAALLPQLRHALREIRAGPRSLRVRLLEEGLAQQESRFAGFCAADGTL